MSNDKNIEINSVRELSCWTPSISSSRTLKSTVKQPLTNRLQLDFSFLNQEQQSNRSSASTKPHSKKKARQSNVNKDTTLVSPTILKKKTSPKVGKSIETGKKISYDDNSPIDQATLTNILTDITNIVHAKSKKIGKVFRDFDKDNNGTISHDEFAECMQSFGVDSCYSKPIIKLIDKDNSGNIDYQEFVKSFLQNEESTELCNLNLKKENLKGIKTFSINNGDVSMHFEEKPINDTHQQIMDKILIKHRNLREAFRKYDIDNSGTVDYGEFESLMKEYGLAGNSVTELIKAFDKKSQGFIDYEEFCSGMSLNQKNVQIKGLRNADIESTGVKILKSQKTCPENCTPFYVQSDRVLNAAEKKVKAAQDKILDTLAKTSLADESRAVSKFFKKCNSDKFGFVKKKYLQDCLKKKFDLSETEIDALFKHMNVKDDNEIHHNGFLDSLKRNDKPGTDKNYEGLSYSKMNSHDRKRFKDALRIQQLIEQKGKMLKDYFNTRNEMCGSIDIQTKKSMSDISTILSQNGLVISTPRLEAVVFRDKHEAITFCQFVRDTNKSVDQLKGVKEEQNNLRMTHNGTYYGCRGNTIETQHPSSKKHLSKHNFLHHDPSRHEEDVPFRNYSNVSLDTLVKNKFPAGLSSAAIGVPKVKNDVIETIHVNCNELNSRKYQHTRWSEKIMETADDKKLGLGRHRKRMQQRELKDGFKSMGSLLASSSHVNKITQDIKIKKSEGNFYMPHLKTPFAIG